MKLDGAAESIKINLKFSIDDPLDCSNCEQFTS